MIWRRLGRKCPWVYRPTYYIQVCSWKVGRGSGALQAKRALNRVGLCQAGYVIRRSEASGTCQARLLSVSFFFNLVLLQPPCPGKCPVSSKAAIGMCSPVFTMRDMNEGDLYRVGYNNNLTGRPCRSTQIILGCCRVACGA